MKAVKAVKAVEAVEVAVAVELQARAMDRDPQQAVRVVEVEVEVEAAGPELVSHCCLLRPQQHLVVQTRLVQHRLQVLGACCLLLGFPATNRSSRA